MGALPSPKGLATENNLYFTQHPDSQSALASFSMRASIVHGWLVLTAVTCLSPSASAQEWTRFRGPNGTGISTAKTVPTEWTESDYNWHVELPGIGHSSPVVWGDKVFVTSAIDDTAERIVLCLNAADGRVLWKRSYPSTVHHQAPAQ